MLVQIRSKGKKLYLDEDTGKDRCEKHPAGHPIAMSDGKSACLFIYDDDGKPVDDVNIENISPSSVTLEHQDSGKQEKIEF